MSRATLRVVARALQKLRLLAQRALGLKSTGVHAIALTPNGEVVLVRLTYAKGWRLPGGGLKRNEDPQAAVERELREEIGMTGFDSIVRVRDPDREKSFLFLVRGVHFSPRRSLEVEAVRTFPPDRLPGDLAPHASRLLRRLQALL